MGSRGRSRSGGHCSSRKPERWERSAYQEPGEIQRIRACNPVRVWYRHSRTHVIWVMEVLWRVKNRVVFQQERFLEDAVFKVDLKARKDE